MQGTRTASAGSPFPGGRFSQHRLTGAHEPHRRFAPDGRQLFSAPAERGIRTAAGGSPLTGGSFSAPIVRGTRTAAGGFAPNGRLLFCTDCAGHSNCRRRVRPFRAESFPLNLSGGFAVCGRRGRCGARHGALRHPPRGQKGRDTCGFPSSLNSYLSLAS